MKSLSIFALLTVLLFSLVVGSVRSAPPPPGSSAPIVKEEDGVDTSEIELVPLPAGSVPSATAPAATSLNPGHARIAETEPNNTIAEANLLPSTNIVVLGNIYPNADSDFFAITAAAGDRVYAAVFTSFSSSLNFDSNLSLLDAGGLVLEFDNDDGSFGGTSSSIAGTFIPSSGTYYLKVNHNSPTSQLRPYVLYLRVQSDMLISEIEPNNDITRATALSANGWAAGTVSAIGDPDLFSLSLSAGDTVYLSLDLDPERDSLTWNGRVGLGMFDNSILVVNDTSVVSPNSEAFFLTVKESGTYYVFVDETTGQAGSTYHFSVSVFPSETSVGTCTTYTNSTLLAIPDAGLATSSITIPDGSGLVGDLNMSLNVTHAKMQDLDLVLQAPSGNQVGLFTDVGSNSPSELDLILDDEAGIPVGIYAMVNGLRMQPELNYRLSWFDGQTASGTWMLTLADDSISDIGTLNSWSLTVCQPPPRPACSNGSTPVVIFSSDFEANDSGFIHGGAGDEWEYGSPAFDPITTCASGTKCWKTDLDANYNASSSQDLVSPPISLEGITGPVNLSWAQKYQMESATFDHAFVEVFESGDGVSGQRLWEWMDATMQMSLGAPPATPINESAGWGVQTHNINSYLDKSFQVRFHIDSDTTVNLAGLAIDDFVVTACQPPLFLPIIFK